MAKPKFTVARLRELLYYNARTGIFTWAKKSSVGSHICVGEQAGKTVTESGYAKIGIDGHQYFAHRLAYLYATDQWPEAEIDHINGDKFDNRWSNLRAVNRFENRQNLRIPQDNNISGLLGVSPSEGKWAATIVLNAKRLWIGRFSTPEQAHEAYLEAKRTIHPYGTI